MSEPNLETMPLDELRAHIEQKAREAVAEQPRDEQGRFVAQNPPEEGDSLQEAPTEEIDETDPNDVVHNGELVYRLEIPGEDGAGSEIFYGHGPDPLTRERDAYRQLREAKLNANRKIREQNRQIKEKEAAKQQLTEDERFVLRQRLQTEPDVVLNEAIERRLASDPRIKAAEEVSIKNQIDSITAQWVQLNPDFFPDPANGRRMWAEMRANGVTGVPTMADMDKAYQTLNADGLLKAKPTETPAAPAAPRRAPSSGLSTRRSAPAPVPSAQQDFDPYKVPLSELRERIQQDYVKSLHQQ